jgi:uncharacterized protein (TIGR03437 family)
MYRIYKPIFIIIAAILLAAFSCTAQNYAISTIAGQGLFLGDGGPAANARFGTISAIAMAKDGSLYIADSAFHQVRRVGPDGNVTLFAGSSVRGFGGDGGPATSAMLDTPTALVVDSGGALYIGDSGNHRVRVVSIYGNILTVAGNGQVPPSPSISPVFPGEGGAATAASINQVSALSFASNGDLLIADSGNNRIFRVTNHGNISTLAGNATTPAGLGDQPAASATLNAPGGLTADYLGDVYFAEPNMGVVRKIDTSGKMTVLIGTGSSSATPVANGAPLTYPLMQPGSLATDSSGNVYVVETNRISMYMPPNFLSGAVASVQAVAGNIALKISPGTGDGGPALSAAINPRGVALDSQGSLYFADSGSTLDFRNRVRVISSSTVSTFAGGNPPTGKGDKGAATAAELYFPRAIAVDSKGTVYIADTADNRVRAATPDGNINNFAGTGVAGTSGDQGPATAATLNPPTGLALDGSGNVYIDDGSRIRQVNPGGTIATIAGGGASTQEGAPALSASLTQGGSLAVDSQSNVYVDQFARVSQISAANQTVATVAGNGTSGYAGDNGPAVAAQIDDVAGIAVDSSGNLYIADEDNGRVRKVDASGNITTFAGGGTSTADGAAATSAMLNIPLGVAVDATGNVYIAEYGGNRVRVVDSTGAIRTIAGNGLQGFAGDGGVATNAPLNGPTDVKVDAQGNVYIADSLNSSVRKLTPVTAAPTPAISSIVNAGSFSNGPVSPGERVILTGTALGPNSKVMFGGTVAPMLSSSFTSTTVVVPYEVANQTAAQVTVTTGGVTSAALQVQIVPAAPGVFTSSANGVGQALAYGSDGSLNSPNNPAPAGSVVTVLCTGAGVLSPAVATGVPVPSSTPSPVLPVTATLNGEQLEVDQAYSLPGTIGEFAVDVRLAYDADSNSSATLQIVVGSAATQYTSIAVQAAADSGTDSGTDPGSDPGSNAGSDSMLRKRGARKAISRPLPPTK